MIRIVFMGTPQIAVNTLCELINSKDFEVLGVVTPLDKPQGRKMVLTPPPIKECAINNNISVFQTKSIRKDSELIEKMKDLAPDFFVTFAFGQILSQEVLDIPKYGTVNVHASLLPKYRGANPIQHAIYNGDKITGVSTMLTSLGMDEGDICLTEKIEIPDDMTDIDLREKISEISPQLLINTLKGLYEKKITTIKQDDKLATYASKFQKAEGLINFEDTALNIHNKVRAILSWPTGYFEYQGKRVKILSTEIINTEKTEPKKVLSIEKDGITIGTKSGAIKLKDIQPESKNKMNAYAWNNSVKLKIGDYLC